MAGVIELKIKIGKSNVIHSFCITENLNENIILGRDFFKQNKITLNYNNETVILNGHSIPLDDDDYLASLIRMNSDQILPPQSCTICWGKTKRQTKSRHKNLITISGIETGFISQDPGLMVSNSISKIKGKGEVPVFITNNTGKTFHMRKGNVIAKVDKIEGKINYLYSKKNDSQNNKTCHSKLKIDPYYCDELTKLLQNNVDLFAESDLQLGRTKAMEMKLDTGEQQPIRMRPYRTALKQRNVVDEAIDGMLEANIITTSKSPWSFPVVVVDKKDGSKRFCVDFRRLNQVTNNYVWPLPHIDDILTSFGKSKVFSSLNLKSRVLAGANGRTGQRENSIHLSSWIISI